MSGAEASPQPVGVVWHMATADAPAAPAPTLPATFGRVGPEAEAELAQAMGQEGLALVGRRFEAGRRCYAAWTLGQLAAYGWVSFGEEHVGELGMHLRLMPNEAYIWDCLTLAAYRRRRLYAALLGHMAEALRVEGVQAIWIGADADNQPSQAGIARAGFRAVADLVAVPPDPGERRRRAWLQARPGISQTLLAEARRAYMGGSDEVWLFDNQKREDKMLSNLEYHGTIPASDLARARRFYEDKLGLKAEASEGGLIFHCKNSWFLVYPTQGAGTAPHTLGGWQTDDLDREMADLRSRGVVFEDYDYPGLKTVNGVAERGFVRSSWFKDSEGNLLGLIQLAQH